MRLERQFRQEVQDIWKGLGNRRKMKDRRDKRHRKDWLWLVKDSFCDNQCYNLYQCWISFHLSLLALFTSLPEFNSQATELFILLRENNRLLQETAENLNERCILIFAVNIKWKPLSQDWTKERENNAIKGNYKITNSMKGNFKITSSKKGNYKMPCVPPQTNKKTSMKGNLKAPLLVYNLFLLQRHYFY